MDGRVLVCRRCGTSVRVFELPGPYIDPDLYVGLVCRDLHDDAPPTAEPEPQLALLVAPEETRDYDPDMAEIPF